MYVLYVCSVIVDEISDCNERMAKGEEERKKKRKKKERKEKERNEERRKVERGGMNWTGRVKEGEEEKG